MTFEEIRKKHGLGSNESETSSVKQESCTP